MRCVAFFVCAFGLYAQGTDPKAKPEDYDVHAAIRNITIGAEFMIHSFSGEGVTYVAANYLVVEVALFPAKSTELEIQAGDFTLRLNGRKLVPFTNPETLKMALQHPEYSPDHPYLEGDIGVAGRTVRIGGPPPVPPVSPGQEPGTVGTTRPRYDPTAGIPHEPVVKATDLVVQTALPEGKTRQPVSGYLYFAYDGKASKLKSVELLYRDAVLKLR